MIVELSEAHDVATIPQLRLGQHAASTVVSRSASYCVCVWTYETDGVRWFDPDQDSLYPDRIRRRPPGANSGGLGAHLDPGTLDLWMTRAY